MSPKLSFSSVTAAVRANLSVGASVGLVAAVTACFTSAFSAICIGESKTAAGQLPYSIASAAFFTDLVRLTASIVLLLPQWLFQRGLVALQRNGKQRHASLSNSKLVVEKLNLRSTDDAVSEMGDGGEEYSLASTPRDASPRAANVTVVEGQYDSIYELDDDEHHHEQEQENLDEIVAPMLAEETLARHRNTKRWQQVKSLVIYCLLFSVPCFLWWIAGITSWMALGKVDAKTHSLLGNARIVVVAFLCRIILKNKINLTQMISLVILGLSVTVAQLSGMRNGSGSDGSDSSGVDSTQLLVGIGLIFLMITSGSLGGVVCELLMNKGKGKSEGNTKNQEKASSTQVKTTLIEQSIIIHFWTTSFNLIYMLISDVFIPLASGSPVNILSGYNGFALASIGLSATGGLINLVVLAFGGNVLGVFSGCFVLAIVAAYEFVTQLVATGSAHIDLIFVLSVLIMACATLVYVRAKSKPTPQPEKPTAATEGQDQPAAQQQ